MNAPALAEFEAPASWQRIEFISDLHLSESQPATFDTWAAYMRGTTADAVFILGDLFEAWVGDDARHAGFEAQCAAVLSAAARRRTLAFMAGNRDFLLGAEMLAACGMAGLPDPTVLKAWGRNVLLTHGDALCLDDTDYQRFRAQVRSPAWIESVLAQPLEQRRRLAAEMRSASEQHKHRHVPPQWSDIDRPSALAWMDAGGCREMVHGHTHRPATEEIAPGRTRFVLSDWDLDGDPRRAEVLQLTRDGFVRTPFGAV
jgi:UDP-2,3-diacylglucosamine hydrolase